jgi:putative nucleotidyltransferase-like protein
MRVRFAQKSLDRQIGGFAAGTQLAVKSSDKLRKGGLVAVALSGAWRRGDLPELNISETELDEVTPLFYGSGGAALAWKRVAKTHLQNTTSAELLHQAYRLHSLQAAMHEEKIAKVFRLLRQAQVDPILAKGWVAARMYVDTALRPYGDIDLCVRREQFRAAEEVLNSPEASDCWVDLHSHFVELSDRTFDEIFERSQLAYLGVEAIRTLGPEDHLALLCIHFLKHGAWRPIWLCDIGAAVESVPQGFDWSVCLGRNKTRASWIESAIGLAERLLQAETTNLPLQSGARLPAWLIENVLNQWANPFAIDQPPMKHPVPMADLLRHPAGLVDGLRKRWPNAILATVSVNGKLNNFPRLPYQVANCFMRMGQLLLHQSVALQNRAR